MAEALPHGVLDLVRCLLVRPAGQGRAVVADEPYTPFATRRPPQPPRASEPLWTLGKAGRLIACAESRSEDPALVITGGQVAGHQALFGRP